MRVQASPPLGVSFHSFSLVLFDFIGYVTNDYQPKINAQQQQPNLNRCHSNKFLNETNKMRSVIDNILSSSQISFQSAGGFFKTTTKKNLCDRRRAAAVATGQITWEALGNVLMGDVGERDSSCKGGWLSWRPWVKYILLCVHLTSGRKQVPSLYRGRKSFFPPLIFSFSLSLSLIFSQFHVHHFRHLRIFFWVCLS